MHGQAPIKAITYTYNTRLWAAGYCRELFEPTEVGVTGFQLNAKQTLYLQATTAGLKYAFMNHSKLTKSRVNELIKLCLFV